MPWQDQISSPPVTHGASARFCHAQVGVGFYLSYKIHSRDMRSILRCPGRDGLSRWAQVFSQWT
ncbi:hypothetical protein RD1_3761 [Roseobacter denitrificans OCh 114]|uniref:Uncharacterized protein n=1 Tax=Roseobacter denitrificans (strain ATCC 33942 / OCh 114) TaxID=375451 RepID=Q161W4_ROSDO|nr:hypothetical protein RD1_3761 [Roseobacter denitrificans OCh 114]